MESNSKKPQITEGQLYALGFRLLKEYNHDEYHTKVFEKGVIQVEITYSGDCTGDRTSELIISELIKNTTYEEIVEICGILNKAPFPTPKPKVYPLTIIASRYGGLYEGAKYIAFNLRPSDIPPEATGDDVACAKFFDEQNGHDLSLIFGKGDSPQQAEHNLYIKQGMSDI